MWNCNNPYAQRDDIIGQLGFESYRDYLRSPLWAAIKARVLKRAKHRCERCGSMRRLQVHHRAYDYATLSGENIDSLTVACRRCHCKAERPTDTARTRYDRLHEASTMLMSTKPDLDERILIWYGKYKSLLRPCADHAERVALVSAFRARASAVATPRCLVCGRKGVNPTLAPKEIGEYRICGDHSWPIIRAACDAVLIEW